MNRKETTNTLEAMLSQLTEDRVGNEVRLIRLKSDVRIAVRRLRAPSTTSGAYEASSILLKAIGHEWCHKCSNAVPKEEMCASTDSEAAICGLCRDEIALEDEAGCAG